MNLSMFLGKPLKRLLINRNCGAGPYYEVMRDADIDKLLERGAKYDEERIRWCIEDENGELVAFSRVHREILAQLSHFLSES